MTESEVLNKHFKKSLTKLRVSENPFILQYKTYTQFILNFQRDSKGSLSMRSG